jgi:hypothetical protein
MRSGEPLELKVTVSPRKVRLAHDRPIEAALYWRPLGNGNFASLPLVHVARDVYQVIMPKEATQSDFEYYIRVGSGQGKGLYFPATAPKLNQTVVTYE